MLVPACGGVGGDDATIEDCAIDLEPELAAMDVPGVSVGLVTGGRLACTATAGMANIEEGRPVTPDTQFAWASVSKTLTATVVMTLHDDGDFALDDDVDDYLPFDVNIPRCPADPVTFRQLLTHTSSIIDEDSTYDHSYGIGDPTVPLGEFVASYVTPGTRYFKRGNFLPRCPGTRARYSNIAFGLLAHVAEEISDTPFDELSEERLLAPLGIERASFRIADLDPTEVAMPYDGSTGRFRPHGHNSIITYPDGLMRASVPEMARFLLMFMAGGELDGERILEESTVDEMMRIQVPRLDDTQGLAWYLEDEDFRGRAVMGHDGEDPGTAALMFFDPDDGSGALIVANAVWNERAAYHLFARLLADAAAR